MSFISTVRERGWNLGVKWAPNDSSFRLNSCRHARLQCVSDKSPLGSEIFLFLGFFYFICLFIALFIYTSLFIFCGWIEIESFLFLKYQQKVRKTRISLFSSKRNFRTVYFRICISSIQICEMNLYDIK